MRTVVELTEKDITKIIAEHFDADENSVVLSVTEVWRGQGPMERKVQVPSAKVTIKEG